MCKYSKIFFLIIFISISFFVIYYNHFAFDHHLSLSKTTFKKLSDWEEDDQTQGLIAFKKSCEEILKRDPKAPFSDLPHSKTNQTWQTICVAANKIVNPNKKIAQDFFETWFIPYSVKDNFNPQGFFTGYYLPQLQGSLKKTKQYTVPIYGVPTDLVKVNLGLFNAELSNKTIVGQLKDNLLIPYPDRAAINKGALGKNANIIAWTDNIIDIFFAQIQGSALLELPDHQQRIMGYASSNGRPYTPIGKVLIANNAIDKKNLSMQTIRTWLIQHPEQAADILNQDASFVFFTLQTKGPLGTEQVPLTPEHSLAVDTHFIPLGAPIWLKTEAPQNNPQNSLSPYQHLLIAQDTGGAIKGIIRGDIYWGAGENAAFSAGHMKQSGRYWILLPAN